VGTLDIGAALLLFTLQTGGKPPWVVLQYIASGLFGQAAYAGGLTMHAAGLLLHYCIAFAFTLFFFRLFVPLKRYVGNTLLIGVGYGVFAWAVMNLVVVPLSGIPRQPFAPVDALINAAILVICLGIPLALMAQSFYRKGLPAN
jgi:uncharacterized membrane protein YagU involved in acid resistance